MNSVTNSTPAPAQQASKLPPSLTDEVARAKARREELGIRQSAAAQARPWALALSGGGIRSATFCLGVLQGLSRAPSREFLSARKNDAEKLSVANNCLAQFDFLSTVSGGGYVGSFFSSLFVPGRLTGAEQETEREAAKRAYGVLQEDPPRRMRMSTAFEPKKPGAAALAWLRDNGRYLTPNGGGDMAYAAAIAIRNWFAVHFVAATIVLALLSISLLVRLIAVQFPGPQGLQTHGPVLGGAVVLSSSWYAIAVAVGLGLPCGIGYWFGHPKTGEGLDSPATGFTSASVAALAFGLTFVVLGCLGRHAEFAPMWSITLLALGVLACAGSLTHFLAGWGGKQTVATQRVRLSRWLTRCLILAAAFAALALIETLSLMAYNMLESGELFAVGSLSTSVTATAVWLIRFIAQRLQTDGSSQKHRVALPLAALAGLLAAALWTLLATALGVFLLWANFGLEAPFVQGLRLREFSFVALISSFVLVLVAAVVGRYPGFVNLSTFQPFYSARLTRAYLGASNYHRFEPKSNSSSKRSVAEPVEGDNLSLNDLYRNQLAPIHFINVCLNQTAGVDGHLVQRDRKGKPLVTAPGGFYLDGDPHPNPNQTTAGDLGSVLTVGDWVGVSGAAVSTGLGRSTSLGTSLLLGFANMRLGRWWPHGIVGDGTKRHASLLRWCFPSQSYLFDEMTARFHGQRLPLAYLSDGGHFENTAAYEMLRPQRNVELVVVCDCGADPDYLFGDLANLIRLARIDHQLEIRVNADVVKNAALLGTFGTPESFRRGADGQLPKPGRQCAILLDVMSSEDPAKAIARIIVLKPVLLDNISADVSNYGAKNPLFPQDSTSDQFFNEEQWESYRKLGLEMVKRIFPQGCDERYAKAFWQAVAVD